MSQRLLNKVAVITGGGSGIGQAMCLRFAAEGAKVAILDMSQDACDATTALCDESANVAGNSKGYVCNVTDQAGMNAIFDQIKADLGEIDIVVNNAGIAHVGNVENTTEADMDRLFAVNVKGVYNGCQAAVKHMKGRGGCILNLASVASSVGISDRFAYSMTKGAVLTMTLSLATDYVKEGIRCNSIAPGRVHTPFVDAFIADNYPGEEDEWFKKLAASQPIGRMGQPSEIASICVFLCSDEASFITGSNYAIDGGFVSIKG